MSQQPKGDAGAEGGGSPSLATIQVLGGASEEQVAALLAVISGVSGSGEEPAPAAASSRWAARERLVRGPVHVGLGGWRASALPR